MKKLGDCPRVFSIEKDLGKIAIDGDAVEDKFAALVQCFSVTCKTTDTIHGVAARYVSENSDDRLTTSSQLADESWAPVAQGHLGARVRSISAPGSSPYWCSASRSCQSYLIDPPRVGLGQRWVRYSAPFLARSKFDLKHERKGRGKMRLVFSGSNWHATISWSFRKFDRATECGANNKCHVRYRYFCLRW
jgi:hypothetical protein